MYLIVNDTTIYQLYYYYINDAFIYEITINIESGVTAIFVLFAENREITNLTQNKILAVINKNKP